MDRKDEAEALRRALYRPDATAEDRARYAALGPGAARSARPRRGALLPVLVAAAGIVVVVGAVVAHLTSGPTARPVVAVASAQPAPPPPILVVDRVATRSVRATGSATVALDVSAVPFSGGSFAVLLSTADGRPAGWRALGLQTRRDWSSYRRVLRSSPARDRRGATRPEALGYRDDPPRWIEVQAAADATWTLTVVARS